MKSLMIVGASRGLGKSVAGFAREHLPNLERVVLISRKSEVSLDMSKDADQAKACQILTDLKPDLFIYAAGGGPHGPFREKEWKDHRWAYEVSFAAPIRLTHAWLQARDTNSIGRAVLVGSRIAEKSPDPLSASYAACKHGLLGFVSSVQDELKGNNRVWLFSPGYMDTDLLPQGASVRHDGSKLMSPDTAAQALLRWVKQEGPWHRVLN